MKIFKILSICLLVFPIITFSGCEKEEIIEKEKISGLIQKGPFINGTQILMADLTNHLEQIGKIFSTQITNDYGAFEVNNVVLSSSYVEFSADGYYFNEVKGMISLSPLTLYAFADVGEIDAVNVNLLTHLEKQRVEYLVKELKEKFADAKSTALSEILAMFGFQEDISGSESLSISSANDGDAILLAVSVILQGNRNVGDMTELLAKIANDLKEDGLLDDQSILDSLRASTLLLDLDAIRSNLVDRYQTLGVGATIPDFEKYINQFIGFTAGGPVASELSVSDITVNSASIRGKVNPNSSSTTVAFEYGETTTYGSSVTADQSPVSDNSPVNVSAALDDLDPGKEYHFRIKAENALGSVYSEDMEFNTNGALPVLTTGSVISVENTSATLQGEVNPNYLSSSISFEYGTTTDYGHSVDAGESPLDGNTLQNVSAEITDLEPGTTYHYRVKAENELGVNYGADSTFMTTLTGETSSVSDIDGNEYQAIGIGYQMWMTENLKTTQYNDGTDIPNITDSVAWINLSTPGFCWFRNDKNTYEYMGVLYNYYTVETGKLCPDGWHVPTKADWQQLIDYLKDDLDGTSSVNFALKATSGWDYGFDENGSDAYGFNGLPVFWRSNEAEFWPITDLPADNFWWSSTESMDEWDFFGPAIFALSPNGWDVGGHNMIRNFDREFGLAVRCLKD